MKVWITRTNPSASLLAQRLGQAGIETLVEPVIRIEPTQCQAPSESFAAVIFVSVHAARLAKLQAVLDTRLYAIGAATAEALQPSVVKKPDADSETSEGLLALPDLQRGNGKNLLLVCGEGGRQLLQDTLLDRGFAVKRFEVYRRVAESVSPVDGANIIVVGSVQGMQVVAEHWDRWGKSKSVTMVVPSMRVAEIGRSLGFKNVHNSAGAAIEETYKCVMKLVKSND